MNGNGTITGTSKYYSDATSQIVTEYGAGNFIAFKVTLPEGVAYTDVKLGMDPSEGTGLVDLDADLNGVFKITDKNTQRFKIVTTVDGVDNVLAYDLSKLVCATEG